MKWDDDVEDLVESQLLNAIRVFRFEKNEEATQQKLYDIASAILSPLRDMGTIVDFKIVCDGRVNDQEAIDENELHMQIGIKLETGARFHPYHFSVILDDMGTAMLIPPDMVGNKHDFVNVE